MRRFYTVLLLTLAASGLYGAAFDLMPPEVLAIVIKPPRPFHLIFAWDASNGYGGAIYWGTNSPGYISRRVGTTNNIAIVSNLWPNTSYQFSMCWVSTNGAESPLYAPLYWPRPKTNFLALGISATVTGPWTTNGVLVNPPAGFYRIHLHAPGYDLDTAPDLKGWRVVTNWPASNTLPNFYLRQGVWDNVSGYQHPD